MIVTNAIAWPFAIGGAISERLEWLTDVMAPPYGPPQNRKLRHTPRTFLNFDGLEEAGLRRWMETLLVNNRAGLWHVPLAIDTTETTAAAAAAATTIEVSTAGRRFQAGGNALLLGRDARTHEVVEIDTVEADEITLAQPTTRAWPAGSMIVPTIGGQLVNAPTLGRFTGSSAPYTISFRAAEPIPWTADFGGTIYRDFPVLDPVLDWSSDPTFIPERNIESLDSGIGPVRLYDRAGMLLPLTRLDVTMVDREQLAEFRSLLYALSGRWQPIWVPSLARDFEIQAVNSSTTIDVEWQGFNDWPIKANRRDIRIDRAGEAPIYRRITAAADVDADTERLVLDSALPGGFSAATVTAISFMALCCQDSDTNALRLWNRDTVTAELTFQGINNDF